MSEALDQAREREQYRISPNGTPNPRTMGDLQQLITQFHPDQAEIDTPAQSSAALEAEINGGKHTVQLSVETRSHSRRSLLLEGLSALQRRQELAAQHGQQASCTVNGKAMVAPPLLSDSGGQVDRLIKHWTGGVRDGLRIRWDLTDGYSYFYCPQTHKLTRAKR